ncbi:hypothetical protein, partial [Rosistilla oblonga]|uniref:hypothetical protein n=1 Tax=Rosistilla oblonga TaxID=2527990 RepID=UPI003A97CBD1
MAIREPSQKSRAHLDLAIHSQAALYKPTNEPSSAPIFRAHLFRQERQQVAHGMSHGTTAPKPIKSPSGQRCEAFSSSGRSAKPAEISTFFQF